MDCRQLRAIVGADPTATCAAVQEHLLGCPACRVYVAQLRASESLIREALCFDVKARKGVVCRVATSGP